MFCQKCGRKLKSDMRFCDYCGCPVDRRYERAETYSSSRSRGATSGRGGSVGAPSKPSPESIKRRAQMERSRKKREQERIRARKNRRNAILLILIAIIVAVLLAYVSNGWMNKELEKEGQEENQSILVNDDAETQEVESEPADEEEASEDTEEEKETKKTQEAKKTEKSESDKYSDIAKKCKEYVNDQMDGVACVYPKSFEPTDKSNERTLESFKDPNGDGILMICAKQEGTSAQGGKLLTEYTDGVGGKIISKDSANEWYSVSFERNNKINHRMAILVDGLCVYYDFSYNSDSENESTYEDYIEYMDYYLKKELNSLSKEDKSDE